MPPIDSVGRPGARDLNVRNDSLPSKPAIAEPFSRGKTEQAPPADGMRRAFNRLLGRDPEVRSNGRFNHGSNSRPNHGSNNGSNVGSNVGSSAQRSPGPSGLAARMWMDNMDLPEPVMEQPPPPYSQAAVPQEPPPYSQVVGQQPPQR